jgi:hypothetical protein
MGSRRNNVVLSAMKKNKKSGNELLFMPP